MSEALRILDNDQVEYQPLPSIYQIELTAACDLACPMCLRNQMARKPRLLKPSLLQEMHKRGEFAGTTFIELQQAGEPTIHPELHSIIRYLKDEVGLMVGMSTHGLNFDKVKVLDACMNLDTLTVSVDSVDPDVYMQMRYPATLDRLMSNLEKLFRECTLAERVDSHIPFIELQLVKTPLVKGSGDIEALAKFVKNKGWDKYCKIRTNQDAFMEMDGRAVVGSMPRPRHCQICLNPFSSVSINSDGDVLSCCMIFDPKKDSPNYYGNLYEQNLIDIWNGPKVEAMRISHLCRVPLGECAKCYTWSPIQIHENIVRGLVTKK